MKYWKIKQLSAAQFKRKTGVKRKTFQVMVRVLKAEEKKKKKSGRPPALRIEDQILMTLQYLREYRTYYHIATDWGISESLNFRFWILDFRLTPYLYVGA